MIIDNKKKQTLKERIFDSDRSTATWRDARFDYYTGVNEKFFA